MRRLLLIVMGALFGMNILPLPVPAIAAGLILSPPSQNLSLGEQQATLSSSFTLTNQTPVTANLRITLLDIDPLASQGNQPVFIDPQQSGVSGLAHFLVLDEDKFSITPNSTHTVHYKILNPSSMTTGGHYGAIIIQDDSPIAASEIHKSNILHSGLAFQIFLEKNGQDQKFNLVLSQLIFAHTWHQLPSTVSLTFFNGGNTHLVPRGTVRLVNQFNVEISKTQINTDSALILPLTIRIFLLSLATEYRAPIFPGRYRLIVDYHYDGQPGITTVEQSFFYFNPFLVAFLGIILVIFLFLQSRKIVRKNTDK